MQQLILGTFSQQSNAEDAVAALKTAGYDSKEISVIMQDKANAKEFAENTGTSNVTESAGHGAMTGGAIGAIAGLLIGIGAIAVPGIGALLIGGPIAAALGLGGAAATTVSGAATGALAGGLIGALVGLGVPKEDAERYEQQVKSGAILLAVAAKSETDQEAYNILQAHHADQTSKVTMQNQ